MKCLHTQLYQEDFHICTDLAEVYNERPKKTLRHHLKQYVIKITTTTLQHSTSLRYYKRKKQTKTRFYTLSSSSAQHFPNHVGVTFQSNQMQCFTRSDCPSDHDVLNPVTWETRDPFDKLVVRTRTLCQNNCNKKQKHRRVHHQSKNVLKPLYMSTKLVMAFLQTTPEFHREG